MKPATRGPCQPAGRPAAVPGPPLINYVRIPVAFSLLLLLAFFPLILGLSEPEYHRASGLTTQPYLWRWLAVTGVLFAGVRGHLRAALPRRAPGPEAQAGAAASRPPDRGVRCCCRGGLLRWCCQQGWLPARDTGPARRPRVQRRDGNVVAAGFAV